MTVKAIYRRGNFVPEEPVDMPEGAEDCIPPRQFESRSDIFRFVQHLPARTNGYKRIETLELINPFR